MSKLIEPGLYEHFKGMRYRVIGVAKHSETLEDLVVYEALYKNKTSKLWVRPKAMFQETIEKNGVEMPRFRFISK